MIKFIQGVLVLFAMVTCFITLCAYSIWLLRFFHLM